MSIKIGNIDISSFKVGSADCRVYLGDTCVYSGDTPTPTGYTYSVTIQGLENDDTTRIRWCDENGSCFKTDSNVGNGIYTVSTATDSIHVQVDWVSNYDLDSDSFGLLSGDSKTVIFTYQGGGGGLVQIPQGTDMLQYVGRSIKRLVIGDTSTTVSTHINQNGAPEYLAITQWVVWGGGQFSSVNSLPIDITLSTPVELTSWGDASTNPFNDLQIEWA